MKIKILFCAVLCLISGKVLGQDILFGDLDQEKKVSISLGFKAGLNLSNLRSGSEDMIKPDFSYRTGFNAGVALQFRFLKRNERSDAESGLLAIQPEINYSLLGGNFEKEGNGFIAKTEGSVSWGYIMIPVMFQVYPKNVFYIELGPEFAYNVKPNADVINVGTYTLDLSDYKSKDVMLGLGAGIKMNDLTIGLRYNHGFSDYAKNLNWMNRAIQLNISYYLRLENKRSENIVISL